MVARHMLRTYVNRSFPSFGLTKCLYQIEIPDLPHMCAPCSELPSNISTMDYTETTTKLYLHYRNKAEMIKVSCQWVRREGESRKTLQA